MNSFLVPLLLETVILKIQNQRKINEGRSKPWKLLCLLVKNSTKSYFFIWGWFQRLSLLEKYHYFLKLILSIRWIGFEKFLLKNLLCTLGFGSVFIVIINLTPFGIICGRQWESFAVKDHLRSILGIIRGTVQFSSFAWDRINLFIKQRFYLRLIYTSSTI